jgi:hypothetical protein
MFMRLFRFHGFGHQVSVFAVPDAVHRIGQFAVAGIHVDKDITR